MSEAKTKAVQAEAKQEAKTVAKTQETMVYAGPTGRADQQSGGRERRHRITERCRLCIL